MNKPFIVCPVCGKHKFPMWEDNGTCICPCCGWAHDTQSEENPLEVCGPNELSLENSKLRYQHYVERNPNYHWEHDRYPEIPQIEPMYCPVCKRFHFDPLTWDDLFCGVVPADVFRPNKAENRRFSRIFSIFHPKSGFDPPQPPETKSPKIFDHMFDHK